MSDFKENKVSDFLWDEDGNHYMVVELNCVLGLDGLDDAKVRRYKVNTTRVGKWYIKKQEKRVYLTDIPTPNELDLTVEEILWNS